MTNIEGTKLTADLNPEKITEAPFEKRLDETSRYYYNELHKVIQEMSDVQQQGYKRAVDIAFSLIDPYRNAVKQRDEAKKTEQLYRRDGEYLFWVGLVFAVCYGLLDKMLFHSDTFLIVVAIVFIINILYSGFIAFTISALRLKQVVHESDREKYLQKWRALGLDWQTLRSLVLLEENEESFEFIERCKLDFDLKRKFERDKRQVPFEVKERLALNVSGRSFLISFGDLDSVEHRDWGNLI